jgi:hypothetical protein
MMETRKIIGVVDELPAKKDVAFPSVRVWIDSPQGCETHGLRQLFPDRGTVYLHVSACGGQHPVQNQIGLFDCEPSPGEKAAWKVTSTSSHLARVVCCPFWEHDSPHLAFWEWLAAHKDGATCNILLGDGTVFVRRGKSELVGPLLLGPDGRLISRKQVFRFDGVEVLNVDVGGRRLELVDAEFLPKGHPLILDPKDAIHRRLKLAHEARRLDWLSRGKIQELSAALAGVTVADGSEWVMESLSRALEVLSSSGNLDEKLAEAILQVKKVDDALELAWKKKHDEAVKKAEGEIEGLKGAAAANRKSIEGLNEGLSGLRQEKPSLEGVLAELNKKIDAAKADAQKVFDAELKRLAQSPASLALLGAWSGGGNKGSDHAQPLIRVQRWPGERQAATNLVTAFTSNLKGCGLSPTSANEVAAVCAASLAAGQPIAFRCLCADLLAEAVATALGQPSAVWADVPAGLLDPVDWDSILPAEEKGQPMVIQAVNRSDIQLVLGSLRFGILRQALGLQKPGNAVLLTLETNSEMQVQPDFQFGSLIDDRVLKFNPTKAITALSAFANYAKDFPEVTPVSEDEFAEMGDDMRSLPLFKSSAQQLVFRRAYVALRKSFDTSADVARVFFKYWCLPRVSSDDARRILEGHKVAWVNDKVLSELAQTLTAND